MKLKRSRAVYLYVKCMRDIKGFYEDQTECTSLSITWSKEPRALKWTVIYVCMKILCDSVCQPTGANVTNCDGILARNVPKAADWSIISLALHMVNNMLMCKSGEHGSRHLLIGQNLEAKRLFILHYYTRNLHVYHRPFALHEWSISKTAHCGKYFFIQNNCLP